MSCEFERDELKWRIDIHIYKLARAEKGQDMSPCHSALMRELTNQLMLDEGNMLTETKRIEMIL